MNNGDEYTILLAVRSVTSQGAEQRGETVIETYRGYVNTWECDDVGHMNVQFYLAKHEQALGYFKQRLGLGPRTSVQRGLRFDTTSSHCHFRNELRVADSLRITGGVCDIDDLGVTVYSEMREAVSDTLSAQFTTRVASIVRNEGDPAPLPADMIARAEALKTIAPDDAAPRSVGPAADRLAALTLAEAEAKGLVPTGFGVVTLAECDTEGLMATPAFMGRYSEGAGHIWHAGGMDRQRLMAEGLGVALMEFHQDQVQAVPAGTVIRVLSGVCGVGRKTVSFAHYLFDAESGACLSIADVTAILLDLTARKSADLTPEDRNRLIALHKEHALRG